MAPRLAGVRLRARVRPDRSAPRRCRPGRGSPGSASSVRCEVASPGSFSSPHQPDRRACVAVVTSGATWKVVATSRSVAAAGIEPAEFEGGCLTRERRNLLEGAHDPRLVAGLVRHHAGLALPVGAVRSSHQSQRFPLSVESPAVVNAAVQPPVVVLSAAPCVPCRCTRQFASTARTTTSATERGRT